MKPREIGNNFERRVAIMFRRWWPLACRGVQFKGGADDPDVRLTRDNPPFYIECKYRTKPVGEVVFKKWYEKALADCSTWAKRCNGGEIPQVLIVYRWKGKPIQVLLPDGFSHVPWIEFKKAIDKKYNKE